ncbi:hypothetical protein ACQKJG_13540 [Priestia megaterium]|uniref:hypothetical protein n=1 Tax=Priestia megaterium TaxID=1404 RepID=UPI003D090963
MIGGQGVDSCGKSGRDETPPAGTQATRRLILRPRKAKPCTEINSGVTSSPDHLSNLFVFRWD